MSREDIILVNLTAKPIDISSNGVLKEMVPPSEIPMKWGTHNDDFPTKVGETFTLETWSTYISIPECKYDKKLYIIDDDMFKFYLGSEHRLKQRPDVVFPIKGGDNGEVTGFARIPFMSA